jgi:signal transduction histidine kinase
MDLKYKMPDIIAEAELKNEAYFEFDFLSDTGITYYIEVSTKKIIFDGIEGFLGVSRDISERKHQQKRIYNAVTSAEEKERSRIARDLHDGVAPILSTVKLYAQSLKAINEEEMKGHIYEKIEETINESIQSVSEISNNLSPHVLRNFGLQTAVSSFIKRITDSKKIEIQLKSNLAERLDEIIEITLYRIIIELLNNTIKHAQATQIIIDLMKYEKISLNYIDNGVGVDNNDFSKGMGMFNLSYRIKSLNGTYTILTEAEKGFRIMITIPLNEK